MTAALLALLSGFHAPSRPVASWSVHSTAVYGKAAQSRTARNRWSDRARGSHLFFSDEGFRGPGVGLLSVPKGRL